MHDTHLDLHISRSGKFIVLIISIIAILFFFISLTYYRSVNKSEDPRIIGTQAQYQRYDKMLKIKDYANAFKILDSIENTYSKFFDYRNSYEVGLIQNSKAVNWLSLALLEINDSVKIVMLDSAKFFATKSIEILGKWIQDFSHLSKNEIIMKIEGFYVPEDTIYKDKNLVEIINKRADEIIIAQKETPRQLSFAYTNLGSVYQYFGDYKLAIQINRKALEIWNDNKTAKNNISNLMDMPTD